MRRIVIGVGFALAKYVEDVGASEIGEHSGGVL